MQNIAKGFYSYFLNQSNMLGKKGIKLQLWVLVDIVFITILILAVFPFLNDVQDSTYFEKRFFSKDIAILMNTIQGMPGDVSYTYQHEALDMSDYMFKFKENSVAVTEQQDIEGRNYLNYPFYDNKFLMNDYAGKLQKPSSISFSKSMDVMRVSAKSSGFSVRNCPKIEGSKISEEGRFFIVHEDSKGAAETLNTLLDGSGIYEKSAVRSGLDVPVLFIINAKKTDENMAELYYLNQNKKSFALGCNIRNALSEEGLFSVRFLPGLDMDTGIDTEGFLALYMKISYKNEDKLLEFSRAVDEGTDRYDEDL